MVAKIYYQESRGEPFIAYVKKYNTCCSRWKKITDDKSITTKQVVNKLIVQKWIGVHCSANITENMHIFYKNCQKHTGSTFPKMLILIWKNKIKGKSNMM